MTEDLTGVSLGNSKVNSPKGYEFLQTHHSNMYHGLATTQHKGNKIVKYQGCDKIVRPSKAIFEQYDFKCHDEDPTRRLKYVEAGLYTSKNSSVKSIKKVTPRVHTAWSNKDRGTKHKSSYKESANSSSTKRRLCSQELLDSKRDRFSGNWTVDNYQQIYSK